jgi:hypothetical protein
MEEREGRVKGKRKTEEKARGTEVNEEKGGV